MPLSTDTTLNFNASAGHVFNATNTEFTGGVCRLKAALGAGNDTVRTPDVDRSGWADNINKVTVTQTEVVGYFHLFLCSFDGGTLWETYEIGGWRRTPLADIATDGMGLDALQNIRNWPLTNNIMFAVYMVRESGGGNGSIDQITIHYGTETPAISGNPGAFDTLGPVETDNDIQPDATAGVDSYITTNGADDNHETENVGLSGNQLTDLYHVVFKFDVSAYTDPFDISEATLTLVTTNSARNGTHYIRRLTRTDWLEDEITWNSYLTGSAWDTPGGDYTTEDQASMNISGGADEVVTASVTALVRDAISLRSGILSLVLMSSDESITGPLAEVKLSDHATAGHRPKLTLTTFVNLSPDFEIDMDHFQPTVEMRFGMGYDSVAPVSTLDRRMIRFQWAARSTADMAVILTFIQEHQDEDFEFTPSGYGAALRWKFGTPAKSLVGPGVWNIECEAIQAFVDENEP